MAKYRVVQAFVLDGPTQEDVDTELELEADVAAPFVEEGKLELVGDQGSAV